MCTKNKTSPLEYKNNFHFGMNYVKIIKKIQIPGSGYSELPYRLVTGGGMLCTCWDIRSVNFFCFLKTSTLQLGMVEHLNVRQNCHKVENHYFQFIHKIFLRIILSDLILQPYDWNKSCQKSHFNNIDPHNQLSRIHRSLKHYSYFKWHCTLFWSK